MIKRNLKFVLACVVALGAVTQVSQAVILDDFNINEGHFASEPNASGTTVGLDGAPSQSKIDRVTTNSPLEGLGHQLLLLVHTNNTTPLRLRHLSGGGSPANNIKITTTSGTDGKIGFYLKTTATGWETSINLDGPGNTIAEMDGSTSLPVIADGNWHLYEWDLDSTTDWGGVPGIGGGHGGFLQDGTHTIDSIYLRDLDGTPGPTAEIYLDFVAWNPNGSIADLLGDPCVKTPGALVLGPISTNSNQVRVIGIDAAASAVTIYQDSGSGMVAIGSTNANLVAGTNTLTINGLVKGAKVIATQTVNGQESCKNPDLALFVGGGANPSVRVALTIRETTDTGPVGASATTTSSGNLHFLGASAMSGGAPINAPVLTPSTNWQTVTFSRGEVVTVGDSANPVGEAIEGTGYPEYSAAAIQVYAFKTLTNDVKVFSATPSGSLFVFSEPAFNIKWTWDAVPGANGYRLLRDFNGSGFTEYHDVVGTNSYIDNNSEWKNGFSVTPSIARSGPSIKWNTGSGDPVGTQNSIPGDWGILESINFAIDSDTGPFNIYIDNISNGSTVFQTFETEPSGTMDYAFRAPSFSGTTSGNLLSTPDLGMVTNLVADTGTNSLNVKFQWSGTNISRWLRLTTSQAGTARNPLVKLDDPISFRILLLPVGTTITPPAQPPTIGYSLSGDQLTLTWTGSFNLQSKNDLSDPSWSNVGVSTSPYTTTITGGTKFYRLQAP